MYEVVSQKGVIISVQIFLKERLALTGMTGKRGDGVAGGRRLCHSVIKISVVYF